MINLKSFVDAIHQAIIGASDTLMDKNVGLLERYFEEKHIEETHKDDSTGESKAQIIDALVPKSVTLAYPVLTAEGNVETTEIRVPLITLVPLGMSQVEKATITADFELALVEDELQLSFPSKKEHKVFNKQDENSRTNGKLEIVISPQDSSDGLKMIVEAYEAVLKRQIA